MTRRYWLLALGACASFSGSLAAQTAPVAADKDVVAHVNGVAITRQQLADEFVDADIVFIHGIWQEMAMAAAYEARRAGIRVTADIYPYLASYTGIGIVFPDWAKPPHDYGQVVQFKFFLQRAHKLFN